MLRQVYQRGNLDFGRMSDLSAALREKLAGAFRLDPLERAEEQRSTDGAVKTLWKLADGAYIESVALPMEEGRWTYCLSTQTGCALRCSFCATGRLGAGRNLSAGEILAQALHLLEPLNLSGEGGDKTRSSNLVFMGMGEPFLNYDNLKIALSVLNHNDLMQVGSRRITVSTVGLPEGILSLSRDFPQVKLAVSLHAAREGLRRELMPVANRVSLDELRQACQRAFELTSRRVTFEYLVIPGINDADEDVEALNRFAAGMPSKINLIPCNPMEGGSFRAPTREELESFQLRLEKVFKQAVTVRRSLGTEIAGACGQLAPKPAESSKPAEPSKLSEPPRPSGPSSRPSRTTRPSGTSKPSGTRRPSGTAKTSGSPKSSGPARPPRRG